MEVGWQRITELHITRHGVTKQINILKTVSNQGYLFIAVYQLNRTQ